MYKKFESPASSDTAKFYDGLLEGKEMRGILGKTKRFDAYRVLNKASTKKYFLDVVSPYIKDTDKVLDFGCGSGAFLSAIASSCREIVGVDISKRFIDASSEIIQQLELTNASVRYISPEGLPFEDNSFDLILMVDVIHHLETIHDTVEEVMRVLKPKGRVLIFEPSNFSLPVVMLHLFDRNEWGIFKLGTPKRYRKLLSNYMNIDEISYNGIVIGPESALFHIASEILNHNFLKPFLGWMNPKIFISGHGK